MRKIILSAASISVSQIHAHWSSVDPAISDVVRFVSVVELDPKHSYETLDALNDVDYAAAQMKLQCVTHGMH